MIKSENGMLRSYVQLNVRDRDLVGFVEEAQRVVDQKVKLPQGMYLEWSGQFEHQVHARKTMQVVFPAGAAADFRHPLSDLQRFVDAVLMMMAVPEALVGGVFFLWLVRATISAWPCRWASSPASAWPPRRASSCWSISRGDRAARRPGKDRLAGRIPPGGHRGGRPPAAAEAADRGRGDHRPGPHALGPAAWATK